jgi:hypothetical protein
MTVTLRRTAVSLICRQARSRRNIAPPTVIVRSVAMTDFRVTKPKGDDDLLIEALARLDALAQRLDLLERRQRRPVEVALINK